MICKDIFKYIPCDKQDDFCKALIAIPTISLDVLNEMYEYFCKINNTVLQRECLYKKINVFAMKSSLGIDDARRLYDCIKKIKEYVATDSLDGVLSKAVERLIASLKNNKNIKIIEWLSIISQLCMVMSEQELANIEYAQTLRI